MDYVLWKGQRTCKSRELEGYSGVSFYFSAARLELLREEQGLLLAQHYDKYLLSIQLALLPSPGCLKDDQAISTEERRSFTIVCYSLQQRQRHTSFH